METSHALNVNTFDTQIASNHKTNTLSSSQRKKEYLPFTVKIAQSEIDLSKAIQIRHSAYSRHVPEIAETLIEAERFDYDPGSVVLLAESKLDGSALGSMRIQTNRFEKLKLESSVKLPPWLEGQISAEAARLGVVGNRMGRIVKTIMFKAYYLYCIKEGIDWMVITARSPVDRDYESLLFKDVFPERGYIPMYHDANIPHRVMTLNVPSVEPSWHSANHALYSLFFETMHPDISLENNDDQSFSRIGKIVPTSSIELML